MKSSIITLPITEELKLKLNTVLSQFESYRVGNDINLITETNKNNGVIKMEDHLSTPAKKIEKTRKRKRLSFLEKLFVTEYAS